MGRIKIFDLPKDEKISTEELRKVIGGAVIGPGFTYFPGPHWSVKSSDFTEHSGNSWFPGPHW